MSKSAEHWDIFISHASEDKETFVEPLANALDSFGVKVWYDRFSLKLGDSLSRSIDQGLANADFGLVVLSPAFIAKKWPEYELRGLTARELTGGKVILPVWHNVAIQDILVFSPPLADKLAIQSSQGSPIEIAVKIIEIVRPDILTQIMRRVAHYQAMAKAEIRSVEIKALKPSPIQHENLPAELAGRIRLVRACLLGVYTHSMDFWVDGFKRDAHPSKEVSHWERVATVYREYVSMAPPLSEEQHKNVFKLLFMLGEAEDSENVMAAGASLPDGAFKILSNLYKYPFPVHDIVEKLPFEVPEPPTSDVAKYFSRHDKEVFPKDLPEDLIRKLIKEVDEGA